VAAIEPSALVVAILGFVVLFGGLAVALYVALAGGFEYDEEEADEPDDAGDEDAPSEPT
jgi:hypothetical protein